MSMPSFAIMRLAAMVMNNGLPVYPINALVVEKNGHGPRNGFVRPSGADYDSDGFLPQANCGSRIEIAPIFSQVCLKRSD
jgi:hypothetical protein